MSLFSDTMPKSAIISLSQLGAEPYASVVCYPRADPTEIQSRLLELQKLQITFVAFSGKSSAHTLEILGKGYVGIVVTAYVSNQQFALKMQRIDSERTSLEREAELLTMANRVEVGPKFVAATKHFLLMQLITGNSIEHWLTTHQDKAAVHKVLTNILEQCWRLDEINLDHGELSKAPKHILVDLADKPFIVDFETASTARNASNVTSVCHFLFQGNSKVCQTIADIIGEQNRDDLVVALRIYRKNRTRTNFETILKQTLHT